MTERNSSRLRRKTSTGGTSRGMGGRGAAASSSSRRSAFATSAGSAAMWYARSPIDFDFGCGCQLSLSPGMRSSMRDVASDSFRTSSTMDWTFGIITLLVNRFCAAHYTSAITVETDYRRWAPLLREIAEKKFHIPPEEAEALVNDVFARATDGSGDRGARGALRRRVAGACRSLPCCSLRQRAVRRPAGSARALTCGRTEPTPTQG